MLSQTKIEYIDLFFIQRVSMSDKFINDTNAPGYNFKGYHRLYVIELNPNIIGVPFDHVCIKYGRGNKHRPINSAVDFIAYKPYKMHVFSFDDKQVTVDKESRIKRYNVSKYQSGIKIGSGNNIHDSTETLTLDNASFDKLLTFMKKGCINYDTWDMKMWYLNKNTIKYKFDLVTDMDGLVELKLDDALEPTHSRNDDCANIIVQLCYMIAKCFTSH